MSDTIERRSAEMVAKAVFDNSEFEKYAKESLETLGRFEDKLNSFGTADDLKKVGKSIADTMGTITTEIEKAGRKYSWLEQIAVGAYRKIGEAVTNNLKNEVMKITGVNQAVAGWQKYESEVESVQSIMNATNLGIEEVEKHLKKLSWYTDETSFHYSDMVANIAKFNSAGIKDLGEATDSMIGIANMAGFFGVNANKATHAMQGFAKAMGRGYMTNDSWQWVETAGMNAMAIQQAFVDTAVELGKIKKLGKNLFQTSGGKQFTYEQFKNELSTGWLDKAVMTATFNKYSKSVNDIYKAWQAGGEVETVSSIIDRMGDSLDETSIRALRASQETKTFTDAVGAFEEVVASGWRTTFKYLFGNYEEATKMWSGVVDELWDIFAGAGYKRNDLLKGWYESGGRDALLESIANIWYGLKAIIEPIKEAFDTIFPSTTVERLLTLTETFKTFSEKFRSWFDFGFSKKDKTDKEIEKTTETLETFEDAVARTQSNLDRLYNEVNAGKWGTMWDRWKALGEAGYVWQIVQNEVNKRYTEAGVGNYPTRYDVVDDGTLKYQTKTIKITEEEAETLDSMSDAQLRAQKRSENLMRAMRGLFSVVDMVKDIFSEAGKFIGKTFGKTIAKLKLSPIFDKILEKAGEIGDTFFDLRNKLSKSKIAEIVEKWSDKVSDAIVKVAENAIPLLATAVSWVVKKIQKAGDFLYPILETAVGLIYSVVTNLPKWLKKAYGYVEPFVTDIKNRISPFLESVKKWMNKDALPFVKRLPSIVGPFISNLYKSGKQFITDVWNRVSGSEGFKKFKRALDSAWTSIKEFGKNVWKYLSETGGEYYTTITEFFSKFKTEEGKFDWAALFASGIDWVLDKMSSFLTTLGSMTEQLKDFYDLFKPMGAAEGVYNLVDSVETSSANIEGVAQNYLVPVKELLEKVWTWLKDITTLLKDPISYATDAIHKVIDSVVGMFKGLNLEKLATIFKDTGIGAFFAILAKNMATGAFSIASIPSNFALVLKSVADAVASYQNQINATALLNVAKAIGILTISIIALGSIPSQTLTDIVAALSLLGLVMALIVRAAALYQKFKKVPEEAEKVQSFYQFHFEGSDMVKAFVEPLNVFFNGLNSAIDKNLKKLNSTIRLVALANAIVIVAKTFMDLYKFLEEVSKGGEDAKRRMWETVGFISTIAIALAVITGILGKQKNNGSVGWALSFVTLAIGLQIVIGVVKQIARWDLNTINNAWAAVALASVALIAIAYALHITQTKMAKSKAGSKSKTKNDFLGLSVTLLMFATALLIMTPALLALGTMSGMDFAKAVTVMVLFSLVIAGLTLAAEQIGKNAKDILKGVAGIGAVILLVTLLMAVMESIGLILKIPGAAGTMVVGLLAFVGTLGLLALAIVGLQKIGANKAFTEFAEAVGKFGFGIIAASAAVYIFAAALPLIVDAIYAVGQKLADQNTIAGFIIGLTLLIGAILAVWLATKTQFFQTVWTWIKGGLDAISKIVKPLLDKVTEIVTKVFGWFQEHKVWLTLAILGVVLLVFGILDAIVPTVVDRLVQLLTIVILSLAKTIKTRAPQLINAIWILIKSIFSLIGGVLGKIIAKVDTWFGVEGDPDAFGKEVANKILPDESIDKAMEEVKGKTDKLETDVSKQITNAQKGIQSSIDESAGIDISGAFNLGNVSASIGGIAGGITGAIGSSIKMPSGGFDLISILGGGKENIFNTATEAFSAIPDAVKEQFGVAQLDAETGMGRINEMMSLGGQDIEETVETTANNVEAIEDEHNRLVLQGIPTHQGEVFNLLTNEWEKVENEENAYLSRRRGNRAKQAEEEAPEAEAQAKKVIRDPFINSTDGLAEELKRRAQNVIDTYIGEFTKRDVIARVRSAGYGLAGGLLAGHDERAVINSPSKAMIWRSQMMVAGLVKGVSQNIGQVRNAGALLATTMLGATTNILETSGDLTPTITPVLNMGSVRSGMGYINSAFGRTTLSTMLASDAFTGFNQNQILKQEQIQNINSTNADVVAALGLLRGDVNNLNDSMGGLQVVMDSGQLVGAISRPMDNALGRQNMYKKRGI